MAAFASVSAHMAPAAFEVHIEPAGDGTAIIIATGELDVFTSPELRSALRMRMDRHQGVLLDLSGVTFIDSTAIVALVDAITAAEVNGWNLGIRSTLSASVRRALELTCVLPMLPLIED